jgi:hypothetical protein
MATISKNKIILAFVSTIILIGIVGAGAYAYRHRNEINQRQLQVGLPEAVTFEEIEEQTEPLFTLPLEKVEEAEVEVAVEEESEKEVEIVEEQIEEPVVVSKDSVNYAVPFTSQAPHSNWDLPYQEACEEASVLMAVSFFSPDSVDISTKDAADAEILSLVDMQTQRYGEYQDTTAEETIRFASQRYEHIQFDLLRNPAVIDIQAALSSGSLVIVPAYGRALGNPNFTGDGPLYHMLVIRGYDADRRTFVTNDPGTRNGEAYIYNENVLMSAMGDWNNGDPQNGDKVVIVVSPPVR